MADERRVPEEVISAYNSNIFVDEITARIKKWGSSLGVIIPADVARRNGLAPGDPVRLRLEPAGLRMEDIAGMFQEELSDLDWDAAEKELASGWDND